jgi:hypothetical protein
LSPETRHTKMTRFLCQELLYEYATGQLDDSRRRDMDEYLATCHDSRRELENLKKGMAYCASVTEITVSPSLHQALLGFEPLWKKRLRGWTLWSSQRGWRLLPYAFIFLALGLGLAVTQPWRDHRRPELILAEHKASEQKSNEGALPTALAKAGEIKAPEEAKPAQPLAAAPSVMAPAEAPTVPVVAAPIAVTPVPAVAAASTPPPEPARPAAAASAAARAKAEEANADDRASDEHLPGSGKGELLRGEIAVGDFGAASPAIRDKIISLGGKAAGSVELGWLRRPNESYFHFSLPESNYEDLESFLKTFGPVRIKKERHPRVMPEGQIRIILTVKDGGESNEGEAEAP